jgi:hypothetical protein
MCFMLAAVGKHQQWLPQSPQQLIGALLPCWHVWSAMHVYYRRSLSVLHFFMS